MKYSVGQEPISHAVRNKSKSGIGRCPEFATVTNSDSRSFYFEQSKTLLVNVNIKMAKTSFQIFLV